MTATLYNQYIWLIDTIRCAGFISKHELDELWAKCPLNTKQETEYPLRTFHRHREVINEIFGIYIGCSKVDGCSYYVSKGPGLHNSICLQLCNSLSYANLLLDSPELRKRCFFDTKDDGSDSLSIILYAMRDKTSLRLEFKDKNRFPVAVVPYCVREYEGFWYLAAKPVNGDEQEVSVYRLTEVARILQLPDKKTMPRWFNGEFFFNSYFEHASSKKSSSKVPAKEKAEKKVKDTAPKESKKKEPQKKEPAKPEVSAGEQLSLF